MPRQIKRIARTHKPDAGIQNYRQALARIAQLEQQQKACLKEIGALRKANSCKDNFLAVLGHELRNPLAAINGGVQIIKLAPEKKDGALEMIAQNLHIMSCLLDDLMDLTRIENDKIRMNMQVISLKGYMQKIAESAQVIAGSRYQSLSLDLPDGDLHIKADPLRLGQVINNLLTNASKYTPDHGSLYLKLSQNDGEAVIEVEDNGIGIPEDMRQAIFEPFVQIESAKNECGGVGIGLALVKKLTDMMGGRITLESGRENRGTKFSIYFPLTNKE